MSKIKKTLPYGEQISAGDSDSILASMYRALLWVANIPLHSFEKMLVRYIQRTYREASNVKDRTSLKASLYKELMADRITWRVFVKGMRVLNVTRFEITIKAFDPTNKVVEVSKMINLQEEILDDEESSDSE
jgi:hypothetical protein